MFSDGHDFRSLVLRGKADKIVPSHKNWAHRWHPEDATIYGIQFS